MQKKITHDLFHKFTLEDLYLTNLTAEQLEVLLPASNPQVDKLIRDRIKELNDEKLTGNG
jgi:hypothetical protein